MRNPCQGESGTIPLVATYIYLLAVLAFLFGLSIPISAAVGGSISGTVKDASGAVIAESHRDRDNTETGVQRTAVTNDAGAYSFPNFPVGQYNLDVTSAGFRPYRRASITVDVNSAILVDAVLEVGETQETVTVQESAVQAETASTQLGDVITASTWWLCRSTDAAIPTCLRFSPAYSHHHDHIPTVQGLGQTVFSPSGDLNAGTISINGQRESANGYLVNGADAEETGSMAAAIIPNLDSIAEFRILSDNFDAEYGRYTGGQINVITKSGTNQFHGDVFEFLRNTDLDSRNYFSPTRATFIQNQFGGTVGGPIVRKKIFFFSDYQGTRQIQGTDTGLIPVPSLQDRTGNLSDQASSLTGTVSPDLSRAGTGHLHRGSADAEARLSGFRRRTLLFPGMHQCHMCFSKRCDPAERVVRSGSGFVEVYPAAESWRRK